jgi:type II secretory pathway component GspD/PulD (secretin)
LHIIRPCFLATMSVLLLAACTRTMVQKETLRQVIEYKQLTKADPREYASLVAQLYPVVADCDFRTNTVIVQGSPDDVGAAIKLMERVEFPGYIDDSSLYGPHIFMKYVHHAKARDLVPVLEEMTTKGAFDEFAPPLFLAYERTNVLIIKANRADEDRIRNTIDELDNLPEQK